MSATKVNNVNSYDVVIIGAGPAGASAARELVKSGRKVLVVEKKKLPRYKICSGLIMDRAQDLVLEKFGTPPPEVFCSPGLLKGVRFSTAGDTLSDLPLGKPQVLNVWRSAFDHWLIGQSGADLLESHRLIGLSQTDSEVQATIIGPDQKPFQIKASHLIAADGGRSRVRPLLAPAFEKTVRFSNFIQAYCIGTIDLDPEHFYMFFDPSLSAFYTWLHVKDDYIVYGVGAYKGKSVLHCLKDSTDYLGSRFGMKINRVERRTGCVVSDMPIKNNFFLGEGRVLMAGEAAGFMNIFGEGISSAVATGTLAGSAVCLAEAACEKVLPLYAEMVKIEQKMTKKSWDMAGSLMKKT
jgi:flavin-dependent dehydrogenase